MHHIAFKMQLHKGCEAEYKKRHDALWPDLKTLQKKKGIEDYSPKLNCVPYIQRNFNRSFKRKIGKGRKEKDK